MPNGSKYFYEMALSQMFMVGPRTARVLIENLGSAEAVFKEKPEFLRKVGAVGNYLADESYRQAALNRAEKEVSFIDNNNVETLFFYDDGYPTRLKQCTDAPLLLYKTGNVNFETKKIIAVVGTRKITQYGKDMANNFIKQLSETVDDVLIVSGLAYGVDIVSHRAALEYGVPTVGVVAHGVDTIYPSAHKNTAAQMVNNGGAILTEYMSKTNPDPQNFVQRNRIVAGISDVTVVVESASKGGALITANLANDYNRDVMAFPGRVGDEYSSGCLKLIKDHKAEMITSAEDLLKLMNWEKNVAKEQTLFPVVNETQQSVLDLLKQENLLHINVISNALNLPIQKTSALLTEMVFDDLIQQLPGDIYALR